MGIILLFFDFVKHGTGLCPVLSRKNRVNEEFLVEINKKYSYKEWENKSLTQRTVCHKIVLGMTKC